MCSSEVVCSKKLYTPWSIYRKFTVDPGDMVVIYAKKQGKILKKQLFAKEIN
jgi:hypothetical protein